VCELAREAGALTVGIVTKPFLFEGRKRMRQADEGIAEMAKHVDTMIVVPNERLLAVVGKGIPFQDALKKADEVLLHATSGISTIISGIGMINVDFADVRTVMKDGGAALMGTGIGRGDNRAMEAAQQAISSPLLDNVSISGATGVLLNVTGGQDLSIGEVTAIADIIHDAAGDDAEIIFGAVQEPSMQGEIRVTVVATGFGKSHTVSVPSHSHSRISTGTPVIPIDGGRPRPVIGSAYQGQPAGGGGAAPARRVAPQPAPERRPQPDLDDLEIPTFIRRQMD
jgi:cell division protein FtsZ